MVLSVSWSAPYIIFNLQYWHLRFIFLVAAVQREPWIVCRWVSVINRQIQGIWIEGTSRITKMIALAADSVSNEVTTQSRPNQPAHNQRQNPGIGRFKIHLVRTIGRLNLVPGLLFPEQRR